MTTTRSGSYTDTIKREQLWRAFENPEYRRAYAADVGTGLAFQIRSLREARGWTQEGLAERTGKKQETISQWENPDYGRYSLKTLTELANAFDVGLAARFVPFSELVNWSVGLNAEHLAPASYQEERSYRTLLTSGAQPAVAAAAVTATTASLVAGLKDDEVELVAGTKTLDAEQAKDNQYALAA